MTSIDISNGLLKKAYHDIKNPLANLILLTETSDTSTADSLIPVMRMINDEVWKIVYKLDMLQSLTQSSTTNDTTKNNIRIDELIDEVIDDFYKTDPNFHVRVSLSETIEDSQLLIAANSNSLSRLLSFILRQLHASNLTTHWYIYLSYTAQGLKIVFSKNNDPVISDVCEWLTSFDNHWEWLAAQKIAKQHKLELSVAYSNHHLTSIMLTQAI